MARDIVRSKRKKASELYDHTKKDLKKIILELGSDYNGNAYKKMGEIIVSEVKERCTEQCLLFLR